MNKFFAKSKGTKIKVLGTDYSYLGKLLSKNGQDSVAILTLNQAVPMITDQSSQDVLDIYQLIAQLYFKDQNFAMATVYYRKKITTAPSQANVNDYYFLGLAQYYNKQYPGADSSFTKVTTSNPDLPVGYQWRARTKALIDTTLALSKPIYEQYIQKVGSDTAKNKAGLIEAYSQLGFYYFLQKDKANASVNYKRVLSLDPENAQAKNYFESLKPRPAPKTEGKK